MFLKITDDKSTLVQVMAWCHQAISSNLNQCWPTFMSPYGIIRPQLSSLWHLYEADTPISQAWISHYITHYHKNQVMDGCNEGNNKPLPEPMLTNIYVAIWHHKATTGFIVTCFRQFNVSAMNMSLYHTLLQDMWLLIHHHQATIGLIVTFMRQ